MKSLKLLAVASALTVFFAAASVVYGGLSWTGLDPVVRLSDGTIVNVELAVPDEAWRLIESPVRVRVNAPAGATLVSEQSGPWGVTTDTRLNVGGDGSLSAKVYKLAVDGRDRFPLEVMISVDGIEQATCTGSSKHGVSCKIDLDAEGDGDGGDEVHHHRGHDGDDDV